MACTGAARTTAACPDPRDPASRGSSFVPLLAGVLLLGPMVPSAGAQHQHGGTEEPAWSAGAQVVPLLTRVSPAMGGEAAAEGYLTHPVLWIARRGERLSLHGMLNLEGLTLQRGELMPGIWGEGYYDRRHPHTVLHEMVGVLHLPAGRPAASLTFGRGFAPFGTDDPMVRPIARYPANHHLAQILERVVLIGAVRWRAVAVEGGVFNGDEPDGPWSQPSLRRFGDSWSGRLTVFPIPGAEAQASLARVAAPEHPAGSGLDHRKRSVSVRWGAPAADPLGGYLLAEWAGTDEYNGDVHLFTFRTALIEGAVSTGPVRIAVRRERTTRPEEERSPSSPFRTARPHADAHLLGITRWELTTGKVEWQRERVGRLGVAPFMELTWARPSARRTPTAWLPREVYGAEQMYTFSLGARLTAGPAHARMGRYGAAADPHTEHPN